MFRKIGISIGISIVMVVMVVVGLSFNSNATERYPTEINKEFEFGMNYMWNNIDSTTQGEINDNYSNIIMLCSTNYLIDNNNDFKNLIEVVKSKNNGKNGKIVEMALKLFKKNFKDIRIQGPSWDGLYWMQRVEVILPWDYMSVRNKKLALKYTRLAWKKANQMY